MRFSVAESEYLAEETMVTIVPYLDHPAFKFISGTFGPLESGLPCKLPLWLAITLRKRGSCIIQAPEWMSAPSLEEFVANERSSRVLGQLPYFYMEVGHMLINNAKEDIPNAEKISSLLQDLENIRMDRLRLGITMTADTVNKDESVVSTALNNVASMEIMAIRSFFIQSMNAFLWLKPPEEPAVQQPAYQQQRTTRTMAFAEEAADATASAPAAAGAAAGRKLRRLRKD